LKQTKHDTLIPNSVFTNKKIKVYIQYNILVSIQYLTHEKQLSRLIK